MTFPSLDPGRPRHPAQDSIRPAALKRDPRRPTGGVAATAGWVRPPGQGTSPRTQVPEAAAVQGSGFWRAAWWASAFPAPAAIS